jgi:hypothetical protein
MTIEPRHQIIVKDALASRQCHRFPIMTIAFEEQLAEIVKPALLWRDRFVTATRFHIADNLSGNRARFGHAHVTVMANGFAEAPPLMSKSNAKNPILI